MSVHRVIGVDKTLPTCAAITARFSSVSIGVTARIPNARARPDVDLDVACMCRLRTGNDGG